MKGVANLIELCKTSNHFNNSNRQGFLFKQNKTQTKRVKKRKNKPSEFRCSCCYAYLNVPPQISVPTRLAIS